VQRAYLASTRLLSALLLVVGVAMVVAALASGGGPGALGVVLGILLALLGAGRLYLTRPQPEQDDQPGADEAAGTPRGARR
jgi:drug/metabolite transporter (DMT)-like permease